MTTVKLANDHAHTLLIDTENGGVAVHNGTKLRRNDVMQYYMRNPKGEFPLLCDPHDHQLRFDETRIPKSACTAFDRPRPLADLFYVWPK